VIFLLADKAVIMKNNNNNNNNNKQTKQQQQQQTVSVSRLNSRLFSNDHLS